CGAVVIQLLTHLLNGSRSHFFYLSDPPKIKMAIKLQGFFPQDRAISPIFCQSIAKITLDKT
ncbi:MAG: hypothetical protein ACK2TT_10200, partial [Anaerolineales bacterium]